jgi:transcriptional regulator with XRE-family HTH domain
MDRRQLNMHIGNRLRAERSGRGLTLMQLAGLCGVSYQQIHKYESGRISISASTLFRIADALSVSIVELFPPGLPASPRTRTQAQPA